MSLKIIGHRGNGRTTETPFTEGKEPQSTLPSFTQAVVNECADGVEFDVFISADGVPIVVERDEIEGQKISDLSYENILGLNLAPDNCRPSLSDALDHLHKLKKQVDTEFILNIELKGRSVVHPTLDVVEHKVQELGFDSSCIRYSSFDRDKLAFVRTRSQDTKIQPTIATFQLFGNKNVSMPGYNVPISAKYNSAALSDLSEFIKRMNCFAIDTPTFDIRPQLIDFAEKHSVGFCTYPSGPRLFSDISILVKNLKELKDFSQTQEVVLKVDDIAASRIVVENLEDIDERDPQTVLNLEKMMGLRFIK